MYWPFRTTTPSQSEIFSVIVALLYVLAFQDQTPSQSEIFSVIVAWYYSEEIFNSDQSELEQVQKIFHFARVIYSEMPIHTIKPQ